MAPKSVLGKVFICIFILGAIGYFGSVLPEVALLFSYKHYAGDRKYEKHGERHVILCGALNIRNIRNFFRDFYGLNREGTSKGTIIVCFLNSSTISILIVESIFARHIVEKSSMRGRCPMEARNLTQISATV